MALNRQIVGNTMDKRNASGEGLEKNEEDVLEIRRGSLLCSSRKFSQIFSCSYVENKIGNERGYIVKISKVLNLLPGFFLLLIVNSEKEYKLREQL